MRVFVNFLFPRVAGQPSAVSCSEGPAPLSNKDDWCCAQSCVSRELTGGTKRNASALFPSRIRVPRTERCYSRPNCSIRLEPLPDLTKPISVPFFLSFCLFIYLSHILFSCVFLLILPSSFSLFFVFLIISVISLIFLPVIIYLPWSFSVSSHIFIFLTFFLYFFLSFITSFGNFLISSHLGLFYLRLFVLLFLSLFPCFFPFSYFYAFLFLRISVFLFIYLFTCLFQSSSFPDLFTFSFSVFPSSFNLVLSIFFLSWFVLYSSCSLFI